MKNKSYLSITIIFLPLLLMLTWLTTLYLPTLLGTDIRLKITGYDPRDLLSGHYLRYTVDYGIPSTSLCAAEKTPSFPINLNGSSPSQCICFQTPLNQEESQAFWSGDCRKRPDECHLYLEGHCEGQQFLTGIERYYFPENLKSSLATLPEKSSLVIKLFRGKGIVQRIDVEGINILEYAKRQQNK